MSDLIEKLRECPGECDCTLGSRAADALEAKDQRIEQLEAALQWEAAVAGDECADLTGEFCFDDKPESPDLWCTYCRIIWVLGEKE